MGLLGLAGLLVSACTHITPRNPGPAPERPAASFSHVLLDRVLERFVDERGRIDYVRLGSDRGELDQYCRLLARFSPDSDPALFPSERSRLAYWINAYNAGVIKTVLHYYPIESVLDVKRPWLLFFFPSKSGFFYFQRIRLGGENMSLYGLEKDVIRKRFGEPRVHFALNCASLGCPVLPRHAFTAERLDEELDTEERTFLSETRNFRIDDEAQTVFLSEIFDWYRKDFVPEKSRTVLDYVRGYLDEGEARALDAVAGRYQIRFTPYDWSLNDSPRSARAESR